MTSIAPSSTPRVDDTMRGLYHKYEILKKGETKQNKMAEYLVLRQDKGWAQKACRFAGEVFIYEMDLLRKSGHLTGDPMEFLTGFTVRKIAEPDDPSARYLVLRLDSGWAMEICRKVALAFAKAVEEENPFLSSAIEDRLRLFGMDVDNAPRHAPGGCGSTSHFESKSAGGCGTCASGGGCSSKVDDAKAFLEKNI